MHVFMCSLEHPRGDRYTECTRARSRYSRLFRAQCSVSRANALSWAFPHPQAPRFDSNLMDNRSSSQTMQQYIPNHQSMWWHSTNSTQTANRTETHKSTSLRRRDNEQFDGTDCRHSDRNCRTKTERERSTYSVWPRFSAHRCAWSPCTVNAIPPMLLTLMHIHIKT